MFCLTSQSVSTGYPLHRSALTSLSTGCLAFGNLVSGLQNLCLSSGQESTTCAFHRDKKVQLVPFIGTRKYNLCLSSGQESTTCAFHRDKKVQLVPFIGTRKYNLCLSSGQESTSCHNIQRYKLHRDKKVHLVITYNVISYIVANFRHGIDPTQMIL